MVTGDYNLIRNVNRKLIIEEIIKYGGKVSRADIAKNTGLNKVTVSSQVADLVEEGLVNEKKGEKASGKSGGKKPLLLSINTEAGYSIGIDLIKDGMKILVTNLGGEIILKKFIEVSNTTENELIKLIIKVIHDIKNEIPESRYSIIGISLGVHGHTAKNGIIVHCDNLKLEDSRLKEKLEEKLSYPINILSNNKLGIIAEKTVYDMNKKCVIYLNMSAGLGGSIVVDNEILYGKNGFGGEIGHMVINIDGKQCHCGNRGCWETYACERAFFDDLAVINNNKINTYKDLPDTITDDNTTLINALDNLIKYTSIGLNNILNIFNPDIIIIHNRIIYKYPNLLEKIKVKIKFRGNVEIKLSEYKDDGVCMGGCIFNILHFLNIDKFKEINLKGETE